MTCCWRTCRTCRGTARHEAETARWSGLPRALAGARSRAVLLRSPRYGRLWPGARGIGMGQSGWGRPVNGGGHARTGVKVALAVVSAAGIGVLAGCSTGSSSTGASTAPGTTVTSGAAGSTSAAAGPATTAPAGASPSTSSAFVPITEPFDPGHPARTTPGPADCASQQTTLAIVQCYEDKTETADAAIDEAQQASFATATVAKQIAMNAADQAWLAVRPTVCE